MKKLAKHIVFFHLVVLCLSAIGIYNSMSVLGHHALSEGQVHHTEYNYLPVSFENSLYTVHSESAVSETNRLPLPTFKNPFSSFSVHSKAAHSLLESKASNYISRVEVTLIQPQIFDILFPFHYFSWLSFLILMVAVLVISVYIITGINGSNYASDNNQIILLVMDTGTIIIGLLFTMLFISPFFFLRDTKRKTRDKELLNSLQALAQRNNSKFTEHKIWNHSAIGIDKDARLLLFVYKSEKQSYDKVINLTEIQSCRVVTTNHTTGFKHESYKVTDLITLSFEFRNKTRPNAVIEIYNDDVDGLTLDGENQLAEEWAKIINSVIKTMNLAKSA